MKLIASLVMACLCSALHGCETTPVVGDSNFAPTSFLRTGSGQLKDWLDERFDVTYRNLKLGGNERENIFAQQPLTDIFYKFENIGRSRKSFHLQAENISRREILYRIARDFGLQMSVENVNGKPAYVRISGNSPGSRFDPGEVIPDEGAVREL